MDLLGQLFAHMSVSMMSVTELRHCPGCTATRRPSCQQERSADRAVVRKGNPWQAPRRAGMLRAASLAALAALADAGASSIVVSKSNVKLAGGATIMTGHGAPTGASIRSGSSGANTGASFPNGMVLAPGSTVTGVSLSYRYIVGYEKTPSGTGSVVSLLISDLDAASNDGDVVYTSPHLTEYSYSHNSSNYSLPVPVHWTGTSKVPAASAGGGLRLQMAFKNNDHNLQILVPFTVNVTCDNHDDGHTSK